MDQTRRTFLKFIATLTATIPLADKFADGKFFSVSPSAGPLKQEVVDETDYAEASMSVSVSCSYGPDGDDKRWN